MSVTQESLYKSIVESQQKFYYFTLTVDGAAIAYALKQVENKQLSWSLFPLFGAIFCWCISFYKGLKRIEAATQHEHLLFERGEIIIGKHKMAGNNPVNIKAGMQAVEQLISETDTKLIKNSTWHFNLLMTGVELFVIWNILEMALRSGFFK